MPDQWKGIPDRLLAPGLTQYDKRMNYQTYDITKQFTARKNGVGVTLASGWWSDAQTFTVRNYNYFGDKEAVLAKIVLTYEDGSRKVYYKYSGLEILWGGSLYVFWIFCRMF